MVKNMSITWSSLPYVQVIRNCDKGNIRFQLFNQLICPPTPQFEELSKRFQDVFLKSNDFDGRVFLNGQEKGSQEKPEM